MAPKEKVLKALLMETGREMSRLLNATQAYPPEKTTELD